MNRKLWVAIGCVIVMASGGRAWAAPVGLGLGLHGGYGESKDADSGSALAGVHAVANLTTFLGVAGMVDYKFDEDYAVAGQDYTVRSFPVSAMARVYLPVQGFSPYIGAGVEYRIVKYGGDLFENFEGDDSDSAFGWLAGAGAEFGSGGGRFFGEIRYDKIDAERDIDNAVDNAKDFQYDQWSARAGLTFYFN